MVNNPTAIELLGYLMNDIEDTACRKVLKEVAEALGVGYASGRELPAAGVVAMKWELSDSWVHSVAVFEPIR